MAHKVLKPGKAYRFAIDYTNDPYYGATTDENDQYVLRSRHKQSTYEFYSYVTLYVTNHDRQMTLAMHPVQWGMPKVGYIARCLDQIAELGLKIEALCLDREFYTRNVFEFLLQAQIPFIVLVKKQSEQMKELLQGTQARYVKYRMSGKSPLILTIAVVVKYGMGKRSVLSEGEDIRLLPGSCVAEKSGPAAFTAGTISYPGGVQPRRRREGGSRACRCGHPPSRHRSSGMFPLCSMPPHTDHRCKREHP